MKIFWAFLFCISFLGGLYAFYRLGKAAGKQQVAASEIFIPVADGLALTLRATDTAGAIYIDGLRIFSLPNKAIAITYKGDLPPDGELEDPEMFGITIDRKNAQDGGTGRNINDCWKNEKGACWNPRHVHGISITDGIDTRILFGGATDDS